MVECALLAARGVPVIPRSRTPIAQNMQMRTFLAVEVFLVLGAISACASAAPQACSQEDAKPGAVVTCEVPGFAGRTYDVYLPANYSTARPVPVILAIDGGGGNSRAAARTACPGGDIDSQDCLHAMANRAGVAVVYPNGTRSRLLPNVRTWNAGGGAKGWQCVSGRDVLVTEKDIKTEQIRWTGCRAETILIRADGGGHVWPGGWAYFGERVIGPMVRGWSANRMILDFFSRQPK